MARNKPNSSQWYRMDLHIHTPASKDYHLPDSTLLDVIQHAEQRGLNIIALTDHNTVRGYRQITEEMAQLEWLEQLDRIQPDEKYRLDEYRRLFQSMLVLPGFEFTAMFGFHILGIFSPSTDVRQIEHLLLDLNIHSDALDAGETNIGSSSDVLTAYARINQAGGLVIAAHANSSHGVAMRGLTFGGQTRIAYTQDANLHALEVTDLDRHGRNSTARFFDGSKPEYPRPMRCIQGSDAHRLERDPRNSKNLGVGERATEILLSELTFEAIYEVFKGNDLARTRPYTGPATAPYDHVLAARQEGPSIVQSFHEGMSQKGGNLYAVISDVCAFANTNGGTIYIGVSPNMSDKPAGVPSINQAQEQLKLEIQRKITPPLDVQVDVLPTQAVSVIRIQVPRGSDAPYAIDDNKIFIRDDTETELAVRDEIVQLVLDTHAGSTDQNASDLDSQPKQQNLGGQIDAPRTGVEVTESLERDQAVYHQVRDLRNGNTVRNVTRASARALWHYAITQVEDHPVSNDKIKWQGDISLLQTYSKGGRTRYDLAQRHNGTVHIYYGVTDDGIQDSGHAAWREMLGLSEEE